MILGFKRGDIKGLFSQWETTDYCIESPTDPGLRLWVCNGWSRFRDHGSKPFLEGLTIFEKRAVWNEYKREVRERGLRSIAESLDQNRADQE